MTWLLPLTSDELHLVRNAYSQLISRYTGRNSRLGPWNRISKFCLNTMLDASDDSMRGLGEQRLDSVSMNEAHTSAFWADVEIFPTF